MFRVILVWFNSRALGSLSLSRYHLSHENFLSDPKQMIPEVKTHSELRGKGEEEDFCSSRVISALQTLSASLPWLQPPRLFQEHGQV